MQCYFCLLKLQNIVYIGDAIAKKNLATCYNIQVLVPIYCSKKPNPFKIFFILFSPFF